MSTIFSAFYVWVHSGDNWRIQLNREWRIFLSNLVSTIAAGDICKQLGVGFAIGNGRSRNFRSVESERECAAKSKCKQDATLPTLEACFQ